MTTFELDSEMMKNISEITHRPQVILTDIDDTLTDEGQLKSAAYSALWKLKTAGFKIIPVTGRPAGWCEMIARQWPVDGVVGENGAFYFRYFQKKMRRHFEIPENDRIKNQKKLKLIESEILQKVPGTAVASDQFSRLADLAIDFCEDVPRISEDQIQLIKKIFEDHGAVAKISSIHVNGWFGNYDKLSMIKKMLIQEFKMTPEQIMKNCLFVGDSPNDEPLFSFFTQSVGVANVLNFKDQIKHMPAFVTSASGGEGFSELAEVLLRIQQT